MTVSTQLTTDELVIDVRGISHRYGKRTIYEGLTFQVERGRIFGLLGKNGVGKTTLIKLLMGFLRPSAGSCRVLGEDSHALSPDTKSRIGLLFEGHLAYDFMTIEQVEIFFAPYYPRWRKELYYNLVDRMALPYSHKIKNMSEGQRSQVVLGLIMAQDPELMILDDYTMGLDAGYRRLFLDFLSDFVRKEGKTVFLTSHVIQDLEQLVDDIIFLQRGGDVYKSSLANFMRDFNCFHLVPHKEQHHPKPCNLFHNIENEIDGSYVIYSFNDQEKIEKYLKEHHDVTHGIREMPMSLEDAFIGYTGKY